MKRNDLPPLIPFIVLGLLWKNAASAKLWTPYISALAGTSVGDPPHHDPEWTARRTRSS